MLTLTAPNPFKLDLRVGILCVMCFRQGSECVEVALPGYSACLYTTVTILHHFFEH